MTREELLIVARKYSSPVYVYDGVKILEQYNRLKDAFSEVKNLKINYAVKALSNLSILGLMK